MSRSPHAEHGHRTPPIVWLMMIGALFATIAVAGLMMKSARRQEREAADVRVTRVSTTSWDYGVKARLTPGKTGEQVIECTLPALAFALDIDQSLDPRLPPGPFEGEFTVTFLTGAVRSANVGAIIQGGSVIIRRGEQVLLSDHAAAEERTSLTTIPVSFGKRPQQLSYTFTTDGKRPARLRAIWQPEGSQVPLPLPSDGAALLDDDASRGLALAQQFNCAACHRAADPTLQALLAVNDGPVLGDIGARARPGWLRRWLTSPQKIVEGTAMPDTLHRSDDRAELVEDLTHFLVSMGGPIEEADDPPADLELAETGMVAYHTVGCFACHGPIEPLDSLPGARPSIGQPLRSYEPLGEFQGKTTSTKLAEFLGDPLKTRPSGRMPAQNLTDLEARAITSYLFSRNRPESVVSADGFVIDGDRVERGKAAFAAHGCANCHQVGPDRTPIESTLIAPSLDSLASAQSATGCLSETPEGSAPHFALSNRQRGSLVAFLKSVSRRVCNNVPRERLGAAMSRMNCSACHAFHGDRPPEAAIAQYFATSEEADLGDEGRLPPNLSDVGAKLNPQWFHQVFTESGAARPYMGARMPQYGARNVDSLANDFASAAGVLAQPDHGPDSPAEFRTIGRELVGSKALNCIQCHTVAGRDATGTPGPDLAHMSERLRYDAFSRWVHDPKLVRPGTRMPSFFLAGKGGFTQILDGDADKQVEAIWAYLSQGEFLPLPEGLVDPAGLELAVRDEPIVFRTFIEQAGVRAIACGFPEQVHCAFDAERCRLAMSWEGSFLNAKGAWAARGGSETNPAHVVWTAKDDDAVRIVTGGSWPQPAASLRFRGYRLDDQRRPIFMYEASHGGMTVSIQEQPIPFFDNGRAKMSRRFVLEGPAGVGVDLMGETVTIGDDGKAQVGLEVTW